MEKLKLFGDLVVVAFFEGKNGEEREAKRGKYASAVVSGEAERYRSRLDDWRQGNAPLSPFHWEIEYQEVFERENPGFDAIVGNPPFAGKNSVAAGNPDGYTDWLKDVHVESHGNADLVAHFYRRAFNLIRRNGTFGLIATNTIGQGDTRFTGLRWICLHGGEIFCARKRVKWPGLAAVVVSVVHVMKGPFSGRKRLDEREVETITAFLFHRGGHEDPTRLIANAGKSFVGSVVLGMGFTFDDTDSNGVATPLSDMRGLLAKDPRNQEVIFPYIGGKEVNTSPTHAHHRYVINFGERSEQECRRRWPDLMAIIEAKVKPGRQSQGSIVNPARWWMFARPASDLADASRRLERVIAIARVGQHGSFTFLPAGMVFSEQLIVFPFASGAAFCALQSRPHEIWVRFFGSSMKDDLRYTPSDCFETFPFPENWETHPALDVAGRTYYELALRSCSATTRA